MDKKDKVRWKRVIGFTAIYLSIYVTSAFFHTIKSLEGSPELVWCLQHLWYTATVIIAKVAQSPLMMFSLLQIILSSLFFGFIIDLTLRAIKRHIPPKKHNEKVIAN